MKSPEKFKAFYNFYKKTILLLEKILNKFWIRTIIALILAYSLTWDIRSFSDVKFLLWSCDLVSILLIINLLLFNKAEVYLFIFLVSFTSTIEWIIDFFKMLFGFYAPKTAWMLNSNDNLIYTELQHGLIMLVPFLYFLIFLFKNWKNIDKVESTIIKLSVLISIYYFLLAFLSYYLSIKGFFDVAENINCVLRPCGYPGGVERDFIGLIVYIFHYIKNLILFDLIIIFGIKAIKKL